MTELDAIRERAVARYGDRVAVLECGGRVWCLAAPRGGAFRALWQRFKVQRASPDPTTAADAGVQLARAMLAPIVDGDTEKALREAFDAMGEESPALLDLLGETAEGLALGPLPIRAAPPPSSSAAGDATPTLRPTA